MGYSPVGTTSLPAPGRLVGHTHCEAALIRARIGVDAETNHVDPGRDEISALIPTVPEDQLGSIELT